MYDILTALIEDDEAGRIPRGVAARILSAVILGDRGLTADADMDLREIRSDMAAAGWHCFITEDHHGAAEYKRAHAHVEAVLTTPTSKLS